MTFGSSVVGLLNRGPLLTPESQAVRKRRGYPIQGYVGPNGAGKSLLVALDTLPTLKGLMWSCDNPDHLHTRRGETHGVRRVLSTMRFTTPSGQDHPLWTPLDDFSQIIDCEHVDLILDEVGGAVASSTADDIPMGVKAALQELRRREVVCRWTAPSWSRASKILRECSQGVTLSLGFASVPHQGGVPFAGPHDFQELSLDGESLSISECDIAGDHSHDAGRLWGARRLMYARTFDATVFDEWTTAKREKVRPAVRQLFWRPGSAAESAYDTHAYVEKLGQVTDTGRCDHCGGTRRRKPCSCTSPAVTRAESRRLRDAGLGALLDDVETSDTIHVHA